jgi:hypothetical protein
MAPLDSELAALKRPERMDPLREEDLAALRLTLESAPASLAARETAVARVLLRNGLSDRSLGSWPPYPLYWGVRWRSIDLPEFDPGESERTPIRYGIPPLGEDRFAVRITAPETPGRYVLRITLVQEWLRWLDQAHPPIYRDVEIQVRT